MKTLNIALILLLILSSCKQESSKEYDSQFGYSEKFGNDKNINRLQIETEDVKKITIPNDIEIKKIYFDSIIKASKIVVLETNEDCLINTVDKLLFIGNKLIIYDLKLKKVFMFSDQGKFIRQVGNMGHGPNEFVEITTITIDENKKNIIISDDRLKKIFFYDESGNFIKKTNKYYWSPEFYMLTNGSFIVQQYNNNNLHLPNIKDFQIFIADSTQKITGKALPFSYPKYDSKLNTYYNPKSFNINEKGVLFNPLFTNDIYEFTFSDTAKLKYQLKLGEKDFLNNLENYKSLQDMMDAINNKKLWSFSGLALESGNYLFSKINNAGCFFYNKTSNNLIYGQYTAFIERYKGKNSERRLPIELNNTLASTGHNFVTVCYPFDVLKMYNTKNSVKFSDLQKEIKINDNPILVFYSLKNTVK